MKNSNSLALTDIAKSIPKYVKNTLYIRIRALAC